MKNRTVLTGIKVLSISLHSVKQKQQQHILETKLSVFKAETRAVSLFNDFKNSPESHKCVF